MSHPILAQKVKRYTLPLPEEVYEEIRAQAEKYDRSMKDVLQQCIRFGLTAMRIDDDPNSEILFRERIKVEGSDDDPVVKERESIIRFVW